MDFWLEFNLFWLLTSDGSKKSHNYHQNEIQCDDWTNTCRCNLTEEHCICQHFDALHVTFKNKIENVFNWTKSKQFSRKRAWPLEKLIDLFEISYPIISWCMSSTFLNRPLANRIDFIFFACKSTQICCISSDASFAKINELIEIIDIKKSHAINPNIPRKMVAIW